MRELELKSKTVRVVVMAVEPESAAERAGVAPGDVIQEINRRRIKSVKDYEKSLLRMKKGDTVLLLINRQRSNRFLPVKP